MSNWGVVMKDRKRVCVELGRREEKSPETGRDGSIPPPPLEQLTGSTGGKRSKSTMETGEWAGKEHPNPSALRCLLF